MLQRLLISKFSLSNIYPVPSNVLINPVKRILLTSRNDQQSKAPHLRIPFDGAYLIAEWGGIINRREDLQSLALVNHVFSDAAGLWIWRDIILRAIANCPFTPTQRRLDTLLGRLDRGKMVANLQ